MDLIINEKGCLQSGEEWLERNMLFIATVCLILAFCKVSNINTTGNLTTNISINKNPLNNYLYSFNLVTTFYFLISFECNMFSFFLVVGSADHFR